MDTLKKIDDLRKQKGWSMYKLSMEAGLTVSTITNMFARKTLPSITTLSAICDAFGLTLSQFFADEKNSSVILSEKEIQLLQNYRALSLSNKNAVLELCKNLNSDR